MDTQQNRTMFGIIEFVAVIAKWKRFIFYNVLIITLLAAVISLILPRWYKASATILPPRNQNLLSSLAFSASNISKQLNPLRALAGGATSQELYTYISLLKSHSLLERIVTKFNLMEVYRIGKYSMDDAIKVLLSNATFKVNEEGTLEIEVLDKDAKRATEIANYFISLLDEMNRDLSLREARSTREFIERRVDQNLLDMKNAEDNLKDFQKKSGFIAISEQGNSEITSIANLYALKTKKELEVAILRKTVSEDNSNLQAAILELSEINRKLKDIPDVGINFLRLYRNYVIQQKLYETLFPLLEQAKIEEQRDTPTVLVLDGATIPDYPTLPRKAIIVSIFFTLSFIISLSFALFAEAIELMKVTREMDYNSLMRGWRLLLNWKRKSV